MEDNYDPASLKILMDLTKAIYKEEMDTFTKTNKNFTAHQLEEKHLQILVDSIALVTEAKPLNDIQIEQVKTSLDSLLPFYEQFLPKFQTNSPLAIGIDLGTTNCCLAVFRNNRKVEIIPSYVGKNSTPSYISYAAEFDENDNNTENTENTENSENPEKSENREPFFGEAAKELAHDNLLSTIFDVKRMLGRKHDDPRIQKIKDFWPFEILENDQGYLTIKTGPNSTQSPVEVTAALLKHLKLLAEEYLNSKVHSAVVAVPAYFNAKQRQLTVEACSLAGLSVLQLVNEPTAAAIAYNIHKEKSKDVKDILPSSSKSSLIFDFGGGTFDVAIITVNSNKIHVKAVSGDPHLGGGDIDNNMVDYCLQEFKNKHGVDIHQARISSSSPEVSKRIFKRLRLLRIECERQKEFLSQAQKVVVSLDAMHGSQDLVVPITRQKFNEINAPIFEKCIEVMKEVLEDCGMEKEDIDEVVLVGGSCRIPKLQEMVSDFFEGKQLCRSIDAEEAVAVGAAMLAYYAENVEVPNVLIQESETKDLGFGLGSGFGRKGTLPKDSVRFTKKGVASLRNRSISRKKDIRSLRYLPLKHRVPCDIGVYIDEREFKIGVYTQSSRERIESRGSFKEMLSIPPIICVSPEGFFLKQYPDTYKDIQRDSTLCFNVFDLLNLGEGNNSPHRFEVKGVEYTVCSHEIVSVFFKEALDFIGVGVREGGKMVLTMGCLHKSSFVERVKKAVEILGYRDVRILSSLLTMAMGNAEQSGCFMNMQLRPNSTPDECMFVIDVWRDGFAMGNVQLGQEGVNNTDVRSENMIECKGEKFLKGFRSLWDGVESIDGGERDAVKRVFIEVVDELIPEEDIKNNQAYELVYSKPIPPLILEMIEKILRTRVIVLKSQTYGSSLLGASLLAASNSGSVSRILNPYADVDDFRTYLLTLTTDFEGVDKSEEFMLTNKRTFEIPLDRIRNGSKTFHIQLHQQFCSGGESYEICRYYLTVKKAKQPLFSFFRRTVPITIWREGDSDDMYELHVETKSKIPVTLTMQRQDTISCRDACENPAGSKFKRLILSQVFVTN